MIRLLMVKVTRLVAWASLAGLILSSIWPSTAVAGGTTTATTFVLQNLGSSTANVVVDYRAQSGTTTYNQSGITIAAGSSANYDQRSQSQLGGSFVGNVVVSSDQPLGSVVNVIRNATSPGAVNSFESYGGFDASRIGKSVKVPQVIKNVSSAGLLYNTDISIQNTDLSNSAVVTVTFQPISLGTPYVKTGISIPAGGSVTVSQSSQPDNEIGSVFFGSAQITSNRDLAVQTLLTGAANGLDQQLLAIPSYISGTTNPIALPSVYKNIVSQGDSYSTAFLITNFGSITATVTVTYMDLSGNVIGTEGVNVPGSGVLNLDQRSAAGLTSVSTFIGAARAVSTNGQPIQIMVNLRGGSRFAMTYDGVASGGTTMYSPVAYKYITSQGYSWSSTLIVSNMSGSPAPVYVSYLDTRSGKPSALSQGPYIVTDTVQFDLRSHLSAASLPDFFGSIVVTSTVPIGGMVQSRGSGASGDSLFCYRGLTP